MVILKFKSISKIIIENFQIHESLTLEFSNFTGIIGGSDRGKSAIVRAICWCLYNYPSGSNFITQGKNKCMVIVMFDDGTTITRIKGTSVNSYDIFIPSKNNSEEVSLHLEGFGVGPVDEVLNAHGMKMVDYFGDRQSLNVCEQLSQPFFLGESPTTKALILGRLANTEVIDLSIKNTSSDIRSAKASMKEYKEKLKDIKGSLGELKGLNLMEKAIDYSSTRLDKIKLLELKVRNIEIASNKITTLKDKKDGLQLLVDGEDSINDAMSLISDIENQIIKLNKIIKIYSDLKESLFRYESLKSITDNICVEDIQAEIDSLNNIITSSKTLTTIINLNKRIKLLSSNLIELKKLGEITDVHETIDSLNNAINMISVLKNITSVNNKLNESNKRKSTGDKVITDLINKRDTALDNYKNSLLESGTCPLCMSDVDANRIDINNII